MSAAVWELAKAEKAAERAMPDFTSTTGSVKVKASLEWRGSDHAFWSLHVGSNGLFRPAVELDIEQAEAVAAALAEWKRRRSSEVSNQLVDGARMAR